MDQDPFASTGQSAGHSYPPEPEIEIEAPSAPYGGSTHTPAGTRRPDTGDGGRVRAFLEDQLRERPLPTLLLGVLAGWIAGKLLR